MAVPGTLTAASPARAYDFLLGGKDNFAADREAAAKVEAAYGPLPPDGVSLPRQMAARNRQFLDRAVSWAARQGIRQFLDLGAGLPVPAPHRNIHESAREARPGARVAYADTDPVAVRHGRLVLCGDGVSYADADLREPGKVLAHPDVAAVIDAREPAAVILGMVLHFLGADEAAEVVAGYMARLPEGSHVIITSARWADPQLWERVHGAYPLIDLRNHTGADLARIMGGLRPVPPGIAPAKGWQAGWADCPREGGPAYVLGGIGRKG